MKDRPSFNIDKVGKYTVGLSGVTGTSDYQITEVIGNLEGKFNSSELLEKNIDKLNNILVNDSIETLEEKDAIIKQHYIENEIEQSEDVEDIFEFLTEVEIANKLDYYINKNNPISPKKVNNETHIEDKFCRNCGKSFYSFDKFCGNCGNTRNKAI